MLRAGQVVSLDGDPEGHLLVFVVTRDWGGVRLDRFISGCIPRLSRNKAQEIVRACAFAPDGRRRNPSERVRVGETVCLVRPRLHEPQTQVEVPIIFEDEHLVVVNKPPGLPVHPSATYHLHTLTQWLRTRYGEPAPRLGHRLDRETSGVLICARSVGVDRKIKHAFEHRQTEKVYLALVEHTTLPERGVIDLSLRRALKGPHYRIEVAEPSPESGLCARTCFRVLASGSQTQLVALRPVTGRQHQLRVHLAALGSPIIGDKLYGPSGQAAFDAYTVGAFDDLWATRCGASRHLLHAWWLSLPDPVLGKQALKYTAAIPEDMQLAWWAREKCHWPEHLPDPGEFSRTALASVATAGDRLIR